MFGKPRKPEAPAARLIGEWRAETVSGEVHGLITASFSEDGTFLTRNQLDVRGQATAPISQAGRYRVEPLEKSRFRLYMIDENGAPLSSSVRRFADADTMVTEVGRITFHRIAPGGETGGEAGA